MVDVPYEFLCIVSISRCICLYLLMTSQLSHPAFDVVQLEALPMERPAIDVDELEALLMELPPVGGVLGVEGLPMEGPAFDVNEGELLPMNCSGGVDEVNVAPDNWRIEAISANF